MVRDIKVLVTKFVENSLLISTVQLEDYKLNNKLVKENNKIVDMIYQLNLQDEFFQALNLNSNVYVRKQMAGYLETRNYDLVKSLKTYIEVLSSNKLNGIRKELDEYGCRCAIERITNKLKETGTT